MYYGELENSQYILKSDETKGARNKNVLQV